ncbi:hypothetical protein TNCV_786331 [Trichonephila clavipes]|nr:hypothetical protein TNCV_786331 [Trichonephila clavipes]
MTGEGLQENNSSMMDKRPDVQTNVWHQVIQDGPEGAIAKSRRSETEMGMRLDRYWVETRAERKQRKEKTRSSRVGGIVMVRTSGVNRRIL